MVTSLETHWVTDAANGDTDAFGRLVQAHAPAVCAIALAITRDPHGSEEIAQDVFLLAWTRLDQLRDDHSFGPWLRQLARNRSREYLRARGRRSRRTGLDNDAVDRAVAPGDPARHVLEAEARRILDEALEAVPDATREVLVLYYREERSVRQVAHLLGLSEAAVKKRLSRARVRLREEVADRFEGVVQRTIPGAALVVGIVSKLPPRAASGLGVTTATAAGIAATATVVLTVILGAALSSPGSGGPLAPGTSADERADRSSSIASLHHEEPDDDGATDAPDPDGAAPTGIPLGLDPSEWVAFDADGHMTNPVFSTDGKDLAFEVNRPGGSTDLFVARSDGAWAEYDTALIELPGGSGFGNNATIATTPAWHPRGIVVFEGTNQGGTRRLYYHQPGGGVAAQLISTAEVEGDLSSVAISSGGRNMAFVASSRGNGDIAIRDTTTGKLTWLTSTPEQESGLAFWDTRSEVLFTRTVGDEHDILAVDLNGTERAIAAGAGSQTRPRPAGDRVVFFERSSQDWEWSLMSVDANGGDPKALADRIRLPQRAGPAVSPDGTWVAWTADDREQGNLVFVSRTDGSRRVDVPIPHAAAGEPSLTQIRERTILAYTALSQSGTPWRTLFFTDITDRLE